MGKIIRAKNSLVYLASPYSENPQTNYEKVLGFVVKHYRDTGEVLFSPIIYGHNIALADEIGSVYGLNIEFESWKNFDLTMLSKSDELWVLKLDGWERSEGMKAEIEFAKNYNEYIKKYIKRKRKQIKIKYIEV